MEIDHIEITDCNREKWAKFFTAYRNKLQPNKLVNGYITIEVTESIHVNDLLPFHIVLLACFIECVHSKGYKVSLIFGSESLRSFFYEELRIKDYFVGSQNYISPNFDNVMNLWKVIDKEADAYSIIVTKYFNNKYFENYDMTKLKVALDEVYGNIADHSMSNGSAFSFIKYDSTKNKIHVAICDFGLGIAQTLRNTHSKYLNDKDALRDSINLRVTAGTNSRNKGFGLNNLLSSLSTNDSLRIVSNKGMLVCIGNENDIRIIDLNFEFKGTLIYFDISTDSFPKKEYEEEMTLY